MDQKFKLGDMVRKINGSQWHGRVVGEYSTELTPEGYAVESATERGSVQIYPAAALELWDAAPVAPAGWQMVPVEPTQEMCAAAVEAGGEDGDHHEMLGRTWIAYRAMLAAAPAAPVAQEPVIGWAFHNPDVGWEWHADHPVKSGMAEDATGMRRMTLEQFRQRYGYADAAPPTAEQSVMAMRALATISRMARNEACREGAPAAGQLCTWDAIADMADAAMAGEPAVTPLEAIPAAEQPDTMRVPRETIEVAAWALERFANDTLGGRNAAIALRALLAGGAE